MTGWTLIGRGLRFYWRTHLGVVAGAAVATAVLVGALAVGDSVGNSLDALARARLGTIQLAMAPQGRFFRAALADGLAGELNVPTAAAIQVRGVLTLPGGSRRANNVQVLGVDDRFWRLRGEGARVQALGADEVILNERAAARLGVRAGGEVRLYVREPGALPADAPLSEDGDSRLGFTLTVKAIASDAGFGRFSLQANQVPPYSAFVSRRFLAAKVQRTGLANMILVGGADKTEVSARAANEAVRRRWRLADAGLQLQPAPGQDVLELRSERVFIGRAVVTAAVRARPTATGVLCYLANELRCNGRATPYSMVAAVGPASQAAPWEGGLSGLFPADMADDQIVINSWLAEDLSAGPGDEIELTYYVAAGTRTLEQASRRFRVRAIVPIEGAAADRTLMPAFPQLADAESARDWKTDLVDLGRIRDKDEKYWRSYRGTPKAFITLRAGRRIWGNRFGEATALRFAGKAADAVALEAAIRRRLDPAAVGLFFQPVLRDAMAASGESQDFGQLFLGLSFFLIVAAVLLTALLFAFGVEQRTQEIGTLVALGFSPGRVRWLMLAEGGLLAGLGAAMGAACGLLYTRAILYGLGTVWRGAVGTSVLFYHVRPLTVAVGALVSVAAAVLSMWFVLRRRSTRPVRELLAGEVGDLRLAAGRPGRKLTIGLAIASAAGAAVCLAVGSFGGMATWAAFFVAGALLLVAGMGLCAAWLVTLARRQGPGRMTLASVGLRNAARNPGRSLATVGLLACGSFLIVAVGANRHDPAANWQRRTSPAGGFALVVEISLPVRHDLNSAPGQEAFALSAAAMDGVRVLPLRVRTGDDASCLNLNRAQTPRLLGVRPGRLQSRGAFTFVATAAGLDADRPWLLLDGDLPDGAIPAIGDRNTITWGLGRKLGDEIACTDDAGRPFRVRLVGMLAGSTLQGSLVISEKNFLRRFRSTDGYRMFLIDAPADRVAAVAAELGSALQDVGAEVTTSAHRLAEFNAVTNTYLSIFQVLGGLGMLLGSVALAVVEMRNVVERRGELAVLGAVGFSRRSLEWMVLAEHAGLLLIGLGCGLAAAAVAVAPALQTPAAEVPYVSLALILLAVLLNGGLWAWLAARWALRGPLTAALRNE